MYMSEDEIFEDLLLYRLPEDEKRYLMTVDEDDLILFHHTVGQWIRNQYSLWAPNNPHVNLTDGFHENFPDQVSQRIIERLWTHLTGKTIAPRKEIKQVEPGVYECEHKGHTITVKTAKVEQ